MQKYRVELEIELETLPEHELKQHAREMEIEVDELDLDPPSAELVEQQIICALASEDTDNLFAESDVFYRVKDIVPISSEILDPMDSGGG
jgi:hypothetical protein